MTTALGKKQTLADPQVWRQTRAAARQSVPDEQLDALIDTAVARVQRVAHRRRAGFAWSGGKDSLALQWICERAGVRLCGLGISDLEYPAMLAWITEHMPDELMVISTGQDLRWLIDHPKMLFPQGRYGPEWFKIVNHRGQAEFYKRANLDVLFTGRRRADGNYISKDGTLGYTSKGVNRYAPIADWSHEAVFALIDREGIPMPPCYDWPRGYQIGTGSWPARQWTRSHDHGWSEVWQIDPTVVERAAAGGLVDAQRWLTQTGRA